MTKWIHNCIFTDVKLAVSSPFCWWFIWNGNMNFKVHCCNEWNSCQCRRRITCVCSFWVWLKNVIFFKRSAHLSCWKNRRRLLILYVVSKPKIPKDLNSWGSLFWKSGLKRTWGMLLIFWNNIDSESINLIQGDFIHSECNVGYSG